MMIEVEAKMSLADPESLREKLGELDAVADRELLEINTYYDQDNKAMKSADQGLRIRVETDQDTGQRHCVITHKGPRVHGKLKSRTETEVGVSDANAAGDMLRALGFEPVLTFEKRRSRYLLDGCRVEIDTLPHLGTFLEIEGDNEEQVLSVREKLGMDTAPLIRASYIAMLMTYMQENDLHKKVICMDDADPKPEPAATG
jgi:adenylate cyclase class 2